jgi:hypothetical protein
MVLFVDEGSFVRRSDIAERNWSMLLYLVRNAPLNMQNTAICSIVNESCCMIP